MSHPVVFAEIHGADGAALRRFYAGLFAGRSRRCRAPTTGWRRLKPAGSGSAWARRPRAGRAS